MWFLFVGSALTPALQGRSLQELLSLIDDKPEGYSAIVVAGSAEIRYENVSEAAKEFAAEGNMLGVARASVQS